MALDSETGAWAVIISGVSALFGYGVKSKKIDVEAEQQRAQVEDKRDDAEFVRLQKVIDLQTSMLERQIGRANAAEDRFEAVSRELHELRREVATMDKKLDSLVRSDEEKSNKIAALEAENIRLRRELAAAELRLKEKGEK